MGPIGLSDDGSQFLVVDGHGVPPTGPLWSVPVLGGSPRRLSEAEGFSGSWSQNGRQLVYANRNNLFLANADGSNSHKLASFAETALVADPVFSPDGKAVRFSVIERLDLVSRFWELSTDGTNLHKVHPAPPNAPDECCGHWTASGKYFVYLSGGQLWALPSSAGLFKRHPSPVRLTSSPMPLSPPIPSSDGRKIFVVGRTIRGELVHYDSKSGKLLPFLQGISAEYVNFSRDGQWVVYVSFPDGSLWRSKVDGTERLQLSYPPSFAFMPRWSPDGRRLLFSHLIRTAKPRSSPFLRMEVLRSVCCPMKLRTKRIQTGRRTGARSSSAEGRAIPPPRFASSTLLPISSQRCRARRVSTRRAGRPMDAMYLQSTETRQSSCCSTSRPRSGLKPTRGTSVGWSSPGMASTCISLTPAEMAPSNGST